MPRPLIVVSNRLPFRAVREGRTMALARSPGGLVSAVEPALRSSGGTWIGWSGIAREEGDAAVPLPRDPDIRFVDVRLSSHDVAAYYHGFSNRTLWPLLHYFVGQTHIDAATWRVYERVNERFAAAAAREATDRNALVWVHDYQLLRTPHHLRRIAPGTSSAFFLHVPFPAADVFRVLPWSRDLLRGMLGADYVGFHTATYARHFLDCAEDLLGCPVDREALTVRFAGRLVGVGVHPVSIDVEEAERLAGKAGPRRDGAVRQILSVDRLDYTKGVVQRLEAVERLLERHPAYRKHVRFTQVLVPSREHVRDYGELKRQIDEAVGRINGRFSDGGWTPIRYFARSLPREELFAAYRGADVALVTPLRDGMNLVAKEYAMAQLDDDGVLVLSELAGAADEFQEAVTVSPFDPDEVAAALHRALAMPAEERRARMSALRARVRAHDVHAWVKGFLASARGSVRLARGQRQSPVEDVQRRLAPWLAGRRAVAVLLDYDGTLTPIVKRPDLAVLSRKARLALEQAARNPYLDVTIVTGRGLDDIRERVGMPGFTFVANHGFDIEGPGVELHHADAEANAEAVTAAVDDLERLDVPGALVEAKGATVSFHFRGVAPGEQRSARQRAERAIRRRKLRVTRGKMVVEGRPPVDWDKGTATIWVLTNRHGADWPSRVRALYIGDDATDEDAFRSLRGLGRSIRVVGGGEPVSTVADERLPDPDAVLDLLRWLAAGAFASHGE